MSQINQTPIPMLFRKACRTLSLSIPLLVLVALASALTCPAQDAPAYELWT